MRHAMWIALLAGCSSVQAAPSAAPTVEPTRQAEPSVGQSGEAVPVPGPAAVPAAAPSDQAQPAKAPAASDAQAMVDAHNRVRANHCAAPLTWSAKLAQVAQQWANTLRDKGCQFGHSGGKYGENLAAGTIGTLDPEAVVGMWYGEISQYRFPDGGFSMKTGHFTQVVWRGTHQIGCGRSQCNGMDIWVCEYDPPGNWEGQYRENVLPRGCKGS